MGSGCGDSIVEKSFVPGQLPVPRHLTRCLLLCSGNTIHESQKKVKSFSQKMDIPEGGKPSFLGIDGIFTSFYVAQSEILWYNGANSTLR